MSKLLSIICLMILVLCPARTSAQDVVNSKPEKNVPAIVLEQFQTKFPSHDPVWFSQYQGRYNQKLVFEGRFIFDNRYSSAVFDTDGNLVAFAATIDKSETPKPILKYMQEQYPSYAIIDVLLVTRGNNEETFEVGIYIDKQYVIQVFSKNGVFIRSTRA